jgi:hypothetical protein
MIPIGVISSFPFEQSYERETQEAVPQLTRSYRDPLIFEYVPELMDPEALMRKLLKDFHGLGIDLIEDNIHRD